MLSKFFVFLHLCLGRKRGFSLVEVMIAAGMMGLVSLGVSQIMKNMGQNMRWTETKTEELALINRFNFDLRDSINCTHTFIGRCQGAGAISGRYTTAQACADAIANGSPGGPYQWFPNVQSTGPLLAVRDKNNANIYVPGTIYGTGAGKIRLTSMNWVRTSPVAAPAAGTPGTATVTMVITRLLPGGAAGQTVNTNVNLSVVWASGTQISECYADRNDTILTARVQACQDIMGIWDNNLLTCKLFQGPITGKPLGAAKNQQSRAIEQSYVNDLFVRNCQGPGKHLDITNPNSPTCDVDKTWWDAQCATKGQMVWRVYFDDINADGPKTNAADGETLQVDCKPWCKPDELFQGFDTSGTPLCFSCTNPSGTSNRDDGGDGINQVPMWTKPTGVGAGTLGCVKPYDSTGACNNTVTGVSPNQMVNINVFNGWNGSGFPSCKTVASFPANACGDTSASPTNIMVGYTMGLGGVMTPKCCNKGTACPNPATICANNYNNTSYDACGFLCPGTKANTITNGEPLVYGCTYSNDTNKITRDYPTYTCGPPANNTTTLHTRPCYLGGDKSYHTYAQCRAKVVGGVNGKVSFFSTVDTTLTGSTFLDTGDEVDSFCLLPINQTAGTFGRETTTILDSCPSCTKITFNSAAAAAARTCSTYGWSDANKFGKRYFQRKSSSCDGMSFTDVGGKCGTEGKWPPSVSFTFSTKAMSASTGAPLSSWPGTYISEVFTDRQDHSIPPTMAGNSVDGNWGTIDGVRAVAVDNWWHDENGNCEDTAGWPGTNRSHWEPFNCYSAISAISCK